MLRAAVIVLSILLGHSSYSYALTHLEGKDAESYIGNARQKFTSSLYTYEILKRRHRDSMNGRNSDAVIFIPGESAILYRQRDDGNHRLVLNHPEGRRENPVTTDAYVWNPIQNTLDDDHPYPHVFLDKDGKEIGIIYIGPKTRLKPKINSDGFLEANITVKQVGKRKSQVRGRF